jgi:polyhydroxyalkanoate synthesis repressor PhaR
MTRVIKRYGNRKLYDVQARSYVSLDDLATLVQNGETVQVVDNATGDDITAQTLTLVILEQGKRGTSILPTDLLHSLLRRGEQVIDTGIAGIGQIKHGVDGIVQGSLERVSRVLPTARRDELEQLRSQMAHLEQTLATLLEDRDASADVGPSNGSESPAAPAARKSRRPKQ